VRSVSRARARWINCSTSSIKSASSPLKEKAVWGPFVVADYQPGSYILLNRNSNYW